MNDFNTSNYDCVKLLYENPYLVMNTYMYDILSTGQKG